MPQFDIIFLRNVLIYFDVEMKKEILRRVRRQIRPDGYMIMGGAETTLNLNEDFERVQYQTTAYYRPR
jgi:chemotaxis protein methyltransferase CheR